VALKSPARIRRPALAAARQLAQVAAPLGGLAGEVGAGTWIASTSKGAAPRGLAAAAESP
jgi:hypothetical protein